MSGPWEKYQTGPWTQYAEPEKQEPPKDEGFFSNLGSLLVEGGKRAIGAAQVSPSVIAGDVSEDKAKLLSEQLSMKPSVQPKQLIEAQTAFKDEAAAFEKAKGFRESIGPVADMLLEFGKQAITNPKGAAYLAAQSAANMAPQIAGMIAGGKGGAALGSLGGPGGAAIGAGVGAIGGGFAAGAPLEIGSEFIGRIGDALRERGLEPTEANVAALLRDTPAMEKAVSEARTKGVTTASIDSLMTVGAGRFATGTRRAAIDAARKELGDTADVAKIAARADDMLKARTTGQKLQSAAGRGAGALGIDVAGGGISEAAGQAAAYGKVNLEDVGQEMLGSLGGAALEVPAAAYATATDAFKKPADESPAAPPAPGKADTPPLTLGSEGAFTPVAPPDGSVAMTRDDLAQYEEQQFRQKYEPQKIEQPPDAEQYVKPPSISGTDLDVLLGGRADPLAGAVTARREAAEPASEIPLADNYAFLQREKQRLLQQDQTPETKKLIGRIDDRIGEILKRDIERRRADAEAAKTSVFAQNELPPVESRDVVVGNEELATLQAPERPAEAEIDRKERRSLERLEKMREMPAPPESDAEKRIAELEKERGKIKSTNLYNELIGKLAWKEVNDISPDIGKNLRIKGGRGGAELSDMVADGMLDNFLPPDKRPDSVTFDEQEATEYIKDKLRNKDHLTFDASIQARQLDNQISDMRKEVDSPRMAEYEISEVEPGEAASIDRSATEQDVAEAANIRFQRGAAGRKSIGKQQTQSVVNSIKSRWKNAPDVVVANNMDDPIIPSVVRDQNNKAMAQGATGLPNGFFYKNKAYILADSMASSNDVVETMFHEVLGHYGLRGAFGPEMGKVLADIVKHRRADVEAKARQYGFDINNKADMLEAAEEVLAEMAQTKLGLSFVKRAIAIIRNFLRDLGLPFEMSDADIIQQYLLPAVEFVEGGKRRRVKSGFAAMREPAKVLPTKSATGNDGTFDPENPDILKDLARKLPATIEVDGKQRPTTNNAGKPIAKTEKSVRNFWRWFGDSKVVDAEGKPMVMYHGTRSDFSEFKISTKPGESARAIFVSKTPNIANLFAVGVSGEAKGGNVMPLYVKASKIFDYANDSDLEAVAQEMTKNAGNKERTKDFLKYGSWGAIEGHSTQRAIKALGYDAFYVDEKGHKTLAVFSPAQIKSAIGNDGSFDPANPDIRFKRDNSAGKPIAKTEKSVRNFWRWFGDSKVVDEQGRPLVVYHGTNKNQQGDAFTQFDTYGSNYGLMGQGSYFTDNADLASSYTKKGRGDTPTVYPVYLSIKNPINMDARGDEAAWQKAFPDVDFNEYRPEGVKNEDYFRAVEEHLTDQQMPIYEGAEAMQDGIRSMGYDGITHRGGARFKTAAGNSNTRHQVYIAFDPTQIKSAIGNDGTFDPENPDIRYKRETKPTPTQAGQEALATLEATGMQLQPPEPGRIESIKKAFKAAGEDPALTKDSAKSAVKKFLDKMEVAAFSGDAAFNNDIRRNLQKDFADNPEVLGMLLEASQSQAVHADALATQFIVDGGVVFDPETKKWVSIKREDNFIKLAKQIEKAAEKYGLNKEQTEQIAHTYFVAKRFKDLLKKQNSRDAETDRLKAELEAENENIKQYKKDGDFEKLRTSERAKSDIANDIKKLEKAKVLISDDQRAMIEPGLSLVKNMPELEDISDTWQGIRANAVKAMIDGNLWSMEYAESMLDNAAYVPFYRDEQLDEGGGPQEFIKGMQVKAAEFRLKGSNAAVNDVFDNMVRWTQYAINRSVRNHKALQMVDLGTKLQVGDRKMAEKVKEMDPKKNTIRVFRNGIQEIYSMADPLYVDAFSAISNVTIPSLKFFTWFSNMLRQSVVLYPMFSLAQVPQDAISAMFTSGLKTRYALRIPVLAVKEFLKTLTKTSATHNLLKSYGATGVRDFNATVARNDIQIAAGLRGAKGLGGKAFEYLSHVAMAADNSIRQAVYEASTQQGLSKGEAIEKAFEIINFRRRGTSKLVNLFGQTVPFFYAYMSVQRTALKTLTLVGISPQQRKEALNTLATTSGAVMALSLFYVMMNGGDEEYEKTPTAIRDRTLNIPGTGGLRIPLRPDLFLMPKVLTEHLYHLITDTGLSDGAKFRKSVADGVANAVLSPQPIPQAIKPAFEVAINRDFFQGRPLIGQFEKQKEAERQFNDNTSEFSKMLGEFGVSPIAADHMVRGMFGSVGGLFLYTTNFMINSDPDVPRPELSFRDAMSSLPGTSGFVTKASENALKTDFYALRDEVEKVKNTYNDIKLRSPQELDQFLSDEKNIARLGLAKSTEKIGIQLSKIRRAISQITNAPEDLYSASEKKAAIKELRDVEREMLKSIDLPALRKAAMM